MEKYCPNCTVGELKWESSEDMTDIGCDVPGIADFYHCDNCGAFIEVYVPEINPYKQEEIS